MPRLLFLPPGRTSVIRSVVFPPGIPFPLTDMTRRPRFSSSFLSLSGSAAPLGLIKLRKSEGMEAAGRGRKGRPKWGHRAKKGGQKENKKPRTFPSPPLLAPPFPSLFSGCRISLCLGAKRRGSETRKGEGK